MSFLLPLVLFYLVAGWCSSMLWNLVIILNAAIDAVVKMCSVILKEVDDLTSEVVDMIILLM